MAREILNRGGGVSHIPIYLTDTLAPPAGAAGVNTHLAMLGAPLVKEREAADRVKQSEPILAVIGNPPYKRLKKGEVERLVGRTMNERWEDLKRPVQAAGFGRSLNAIPDLCIAFYRWALWRLFEADGAQGRGTLTYITNRTFLTATGYGGLRQMLRDRFDTIRIIDFRGENRGALPATVDSDANVFQIEVGVCILIASAKGTKPAGQQAEVSYADVWTEKAFSQRDKLTLAQEAAVDPARLRFQKVDGSGMARLKPSGFMDRDWPSLPEVFTFKSNGVVTYRDGFAYATTKETLESRIKNWRKMDIAAAKKEFKDSAMNTAAEAQKPDYDTNAVELRAYRPLDNRHIYAAEKFIDRPRRELTANWGAANAALMALSGGAGSGPAIWSHGLKPDQHAFRGSYGGWVFPLHNPAEAGAHFVDMGVLAGLAAAYGGAVEPQTVYDAVLALLSATSYTTTFAHDLEDDFPNIPFPADGALFAKAAAIGARIRAVQGMVEKTGAVFRKARLEGDAIGKMLEVPTPARAWAGEDGIGEVSLVADGSYRMTGISERVWKFNVSGYPLLYKWLKARSGESLHSDSGATLLRQALDVAWRIEELLTLYDSADDLLAHSLDNTMTRMELNLDPRDVVLVDTEGDDAG